MLRIAAATAFLFASGTSASLTLRPGTPETQPEVSLIDARDVLVGRVVSEERDVLFNTMAGSLGLGASPMGDGLYLVRSDDQAQTASRLAELQRLLRELQPQGAAYNVGIRILRRPLAAVPEIGSRIDVKDAVVLAQVTLRVGEEAPVESVESVSYIGSWSPVVGESSVGYEPVLAEAERGFRGQIRLQPSTSANAVEFFLQGELMNATVSMTEQPLLGPDQRLSFGLATKQRRTVSVSMNAMPVAQVSIIAPPSPDSPLSNLVVLADQSYMVVSVVAGPTLDDVMVIAVRVATAP